MENITIYQVYTNLQLIINEVECSRINENYYWTLNNRRNALNTNYVRSFTDKKDAILYLSSLLMSKINHLEHSVTYYKEQVEKFNSLYNLTNQ